MNKTPLTAPQDKTAVLRLCFGHSAFRPGQEELIDAILAGRDALGVMPTGGGKSMCYQVPALLLPGLTLVISPLISLMKDQVSALKEAGVPAAALNSSLDGTQMAAVCEQMQQGVCRLVYVAPERLEAAGFAALCRTLNISLIAVDEAHCISQWGQDFRPSYLKIPQFIDALPVRPVVAAFTATATETVRQDIVRLLELRDPLQQITGFDRPNLYFDVRRPKNKLDALLSYIKERDGRSGIVYCATRAGVEKTCAALNNAGISATRYHAGLSQTERQRSQNDFQFDRRRIMVATNAFGMGIDKSNVSFVVHMNMPKSMEAYYQEAGRAGRDGEPADCLLLYSSADVITARYMIEHGGSEELSDEDAERVYEQDLQRLRLMEDYCKTTGCLRGKLLDYFGQPHPGRCGCCGNCCDETVEQDVTREAQMVLSCIKRIQGKLGYYVGAAMVVNTLCGAKEKRLLGFGLDELSTYGLLKDRPRAAVRELVDALTDADCLRLNPAHNTLEPGPRANAVLFHAEPVTLLRRTARVRDEKAAQKEPGRPRRAAGADSPLMLALKQTRQQLAEKGNVPLYVIFSNASLADMADRRPHSEAEFLDISGVGAVKARKYGRVFLDTIAAFEQQQAGENASH